MNKKFEKLGFYPADILLPKDQDMRKWAVVACDQFTSQPEYWQRAEHLADGKPSTLHIVLPEAYLGTPQEAERLESIRRTMEEYRKSVLTRKVHGYVYVERTQMDGTVRQGLVGAVDLDAYDYAKGSKPAIRPSESTVVERIPPRLKVRRGAILETPHVMMLADDEKKTLIEPIGDHKDSLPLLYDGELMLGGGHLRGWAVEDPALIDQINAALADLADEKKFAARWPRAAGEPPMVLAVGDGNHSLATAKSCYEELKKNNPGVDLSNHPARYALVELENIHDPAQVFEPIHRVIFKTEPKKLLKALEEACAGAEGFPVKWYAGEESGTIVLDKNKGELAVGILQHFLDDYLKENAGEIDYIHDDDALIGFAKQENAIGFLLPAMEKSQLFRGVIADGVLPRKTFSMGHSREKRYYLEGRKIKA